jgi:hypothetical protein
MKDKADHVRRDTAPRSTGWLQYVVGPMIVGIIVLAGQGIIAPIVAKGVKTEESILDQRYKAYENAVNILQRHLAAVQMTGKKVPGWYVPAEKTKPSQVETNVAYTLLAIYDKDGTVSRQFCSAIVGNPNESAAGTKKIDPQDIRRFVSAVRKELGVSRKGLPSEEFNYLFIRPVDTDTPH